MYSKYNSEKPIELSNPFSIYEPSGLCSIPHYFQETETERIKFEKVEKFSTRNTRSLEVSNCGLFSDRKAVIRPSFSLKLSKKYVFYVQLSEKYDYITACLNGILSIPDITQKIYDAQTGKLAQILAGIIKMTQSNNNSIVYSTKLIEYLDNNYKIPLDQFFSYLFLELSQEPGISNFEELHSIKISTNITCNDCEFSTKTINKSDWLALDPAKTLKAAFDYFFEVSKLETLCEQCSKPLISKKEPVSASNLLIISIQRFRTIPYHYKISSFIKFSKSLNFCDKNYQLYAVITHEGSVETGKFVCFCKRGKSWYSVSDNGITKQSLSNVLNQTSYQLIYYTG